MDYDFKKLDYGKIETKIVSFIKDIVGEKSVVMGLSGGIDSSVSCALAVKALGKERVKVIIVKNTQFTKEGIDTARAYAKSLDVHVQEVDCEGIRDTLLKNLEIRNPDLILQASIDVRICDLIIRTVAQTENRLYMGTINSTERIVGWYPKGTLVGDFCPISGLLKQQLKGIAEYMGLEQLAEGVSNDASIVCGGCGELPEFRGIPYTTLDTALYIYETTTQENLLQKLAECGITGDQWSKILKRIESVSHKNDVFPKFCRVNIK